jgi:AI-2 transport protein TqsA
MPKVLAMIVTFALVVLIFSLVVFLIINSLGQFFEGADLYKAKVISFIGQAKSLAWSYGINVNDSMITNELKELPVAKMLRQLSGGVFSYIGNAFLVLIFTLFMILSTSKTDEKSKLIAELEKKISRYALTKTITSVTTAVIIWIIFRSFKVELAFMFAVLTLLLNFIPSIGSIIATVIPLPLIFLKFEFGFEFITILILTALTQLIIGNIIEPKFMGDAMDLHPITILLFLMFWGLIWGVPGMFMAVPITAILKIVLSRIDSTKPVSELLAGRLSNVF